MFHYDIWRRNLLVQELELPGPAHLALPVPRHQGVQEEDLPLPHQPPLTRPLPTRIQVGRFLDMFSYMADSCM